MNPAMEPTMTLRLSSLTAALLAALALGACRAQPASDDELVEAAEQATAPPEAPSVEHPAAPTPAPTEAAAPTREPIRLTPLTADGAMAPVNSSATRRAQNLERISQIGEGSGEITFRNRIEATVDQQVRANARTEHTRPIPNRMPSQRLDLQQTIRLPANAVLQGGTAPVDTPTTTPR